MLSNWLLLVAPALYLSKTSREQFAPERVPKRSEFIQEKSAVDSGGFNRKGRLKAQKMCIAFWLYLQAILVKLLKRETCTIKWIGLQCHSTKKVSFISSS